MKSQYFGDVNDYLKYGLIRRLTANGLVKATICWMLTEDDGRADGLKLDYLEKEEYRKYDPKLFDKLHQIVKKEDNRSIQQAEEKDLIPSAMYYSAYLTDSKQQREAYFKDFHSIIAKDCSLIFFDPDNGLAVKSIAKRNKNSCKYIFPDEIKACYDRGFSILLYQHFTREKRETFIQNKVEECKALVNVQKVLVYQTAHVVFLLLPQDAHLQGFLQHSSGITEEWENKIAFSTY